MWKYVSRRIRDSFEKSVNHFDKRSSAGVVNSASNFTEDKNKHQKYSNSLCKWFSSSNCLNSLNSENNTNSNKWNFEDLNRTWIGAITWSSALVLGWYTSQLIHLKHKYQCKEHRKCPAINNLFACLHPYVINVNKHAVESNSISKIDDIISCFIPTTYLISNDHHANNAETDAAYSLGSSSSTNSSDNDLGDVLNSIENKLGLAAIEKGQHRDGLNLLRSAANRNHAPALYNLGLCYEMGLGVSADDKMAMELYRTAAALQHPGALYNLGIYYGQGRGGLQRDPCTATRLLRLAAVQGQQDAINALKTLDVEITETPIKDEKEELIYPYKQFVPSDSISSHNTLFENMNFMKAQNYGSPVY